MFAGNSPAKQKARQRHWGLVAERGDHGCDNIGLAGPDLLDLDAAQEASVSRVVLYERDSRVALGHRSKCVVPRDIRTRTQQAGSILLDFCAPLGRDTRDCIEKVSRLLVPPGVLTVTLMRGREIPGTYEHALIAENAGLGSTAARLVAVYSVLPHTTKHWFRPVVAIQYVGHSAPMCQLSFELVKLQSRPKRVGQIAAVIQEMETLL